MFPYYNGHYPYYQYPANTYPNSVYYQGRIFTRGSGLMQKSTWIERGADGRPYYVKRRPAVPSLRQKFAEVINDIRSRNPFFNGPHVSVPSTPTTPTQPSAPAPTPAPQSQAHSRASTPKQKSNLKQKWQPQPEMAERSRTPHSNSQTPHPQPYSQPQQPLSHQQFHPFPFPPYAPTQVGNNSNGQNQQNSALVPSQLAHYAAPHPRMYPYVPSGSQALTHQLTHQPTGGPPPANTTGAMFNPAHTTIPNAPPTAPPGYGPSNPGQFAMNPMSMNPDDLKYKCSICGRFRSSRYQWKHRVPVGQLPGPTICRRCRQEATDSEDESTDSYEERDYRSHSRHRSLARNRSRSRGRASRPRSRARSSSRPKRALDHDYYAAHEPEASSSESDVSVEVRPKRRKSLSRGARSPSVEVIRYVDGPAIQPRPKNRKKKIVYVEDHRSQQELSDDEDEVDVRYVAYPSRSRVVSRPATPARRLFPRQYSDPEIGAAVAFEGREYYDQPPSSRRIRHVSSSSRLYAKNPYRQIRSSSRPRRTYSSAPYETTEEEYYYAPATDRLPRGRMRGGGGRSRSRSRSRVSIDEGAEAGPLDPYRPPVPSPPAPRRRRSSSLGCVEADADLSAEREHPRSSSRHRRRLEAESEAVDDRNPADDYDMYDNDGMRVRVREI
ncbi:hypothetical protein PMZ80_006894 [Knufia obscura]|uniref:Uncharacterized protein n=1 Tax=Knufia obscura TaxID=1635080 RepID=A0ABR0RK19_9EURO|nr:hypothetical protein PMZ80_006894 [Knufia obscura]